MVKACSKWTEKARESWVEWRREKFFSNPSISPNKIPIIAIGDGLSNTTE